MKYFIDTEFHEYSKQPKVLGINVGKPIDTIELISIGIVSEETDKSKEYYAICNEFDLKAAWNNEWLRENVLKSIWEELSSLMNNYHKTYYWKSTEWSYKGLKRLLKWKGKSKKQIAKEIIEFVQDYKFESMMKGKRYDSIFGNGVNNTFYFNIDDEKSDIYVGETCSDKPEFYAYYADYDWVVFCWLFGRMVDLPEGFPMYCIDLKQELDSLKILKQNSNNYPKQINNHNALADAKWNYELYKFIKTY